MRYNGNPLEETPDDDSEKPYFHKLFYLAGLEYLSWEKNNFTTQLNGPLQCFCKQVKKDFNDTVDYGLDFIWDQGYDIYDDKGTKIENQKICSVLIKTEA